jgi:PKD repeat protein
LATGAATATILVTPADDGEVEADETVVLSLAANADYEVGSPSSAEVTITDNDQPPPEKPTVTVSASDVDAAEQGTEPGTFTISRTGSTAASLTVHFSLGGSADNGIDYQSLPTSVTIPAGAASANLSVRPMDDTEVEGDETVVLSVSADSPYMVGSPQSATVTLHDNDEPPTADFTASTLLGIVPLVVTFTDRSTGNPVSWDWNFGDGSRSSAQNPTHIYVVTSTYTVTLTVRNSAGATSSKSATIRAKLL